MDGLLEDYDGFVTSITARLDPYSVGELEFILLDHGARLLKHSKEAFFNAFSSNVAQYHLRVNLNWLLSLQRN